MKHYPDYKKQFKLFFLGFLLIIFTVLPMFFSYAQTAKELQDKIRDRNNQIEKLEKEIKVYQSELNELGQQKNSLAGSIKQLDLTRKKLNADISVTQNKIDKTNFKLESLNTDIGSKQSSISNNLDAIALGIKDINEFEQNTLVEIILSENNFTSSWNDIDNLVTVRNSVRENTLELREVKSSLEGVKEETLVAKKELLELRGKLSDQKKIVDQNTKEKNTLLSQTKNSEATYQKLLAQQVNLKTTFEKEIEDYESQLKFILDADSLPEGRVLSWPLDSILVTSPYAPRWGRFHRGTDFRAAVGTPVKAMADGVVLGTGNTDLTCPKASFGQWVVIKYNNGLSSTYGHLSLIKARQGDKVLRGQIVAYSGNTGSSTGPHLHVSVYAPTDAEGNPGVSVKTIPSKSCMGKTLTQPISATNAYLDPMSYLPKI
ncbi:peptidoglycan DD-metalloendopeptidase family protein [Candidatus Nomurabacteria bacterium]|nr:peptidoglycan DD-metalloendopeptidase family protein [Candidatus Nomurabacteria bacterium]